MSGTAADIPPPPPGFSMVGGAAPSGGSDIPPPPSGFSLVPQETSHPVGQQKTDELMRDLTPAPRSTLQDIRQGTAHGLVSAGSTILGFPQDLWHMLKSENKWALTRGAEAAGIITPEQGAAWREDPPPEQIPGTSAWIADHVKDLAKSHGKDVSPTQTVPGQYAETAANFIPLAAAAPFLGGAEGVGALSQVPMAIARYGVAPAVFSETAGQMTKGTAAEPYARAAAAIAPEALIQGVSQASRWLNPMTGVMENVTPQQVTNAQRILEESRAAGAPLTVPEALQTATGSGTRAGDLQRVVEQSPRGAEIMRPFMAERPGQTEALGRQAFGEIAPAGVDPYEIAPRVQGAAQRVLDTSPHAAALDRSVTALGPPTTAEQAGNVIQPELRNIYERREGMRNALADEDYAAARNAPVPPPAEVTPRQPIVAPPSFVPPGANVPVGPRINALISEDERLAATRPVQIPPGAPQPKNLLSTEPGTVPHAVEYGPERPGQVNVSPVIAHIDDMLVSAKGGVASALRTARRALFSKGQPDMSVRGLSNARNAISDQISSANRAGNNQGSSVLQGVRARLDSALEDVPAYGDARRNFARASEPLAPFADNTAPGRIIERDQFNRGFTMPAERVAPTIERGGPSAADQFLAAADNSPASRQAFGQYYSRQLLGTATDATGRINPDILANTLRDNQDMLQRFPEIAANLDRVGAARRALQILEQTPTGALAATAGKTGQEQFAAQRNLLFAPNPMAGSERTIANTVRAIAEHDPAAAQQFVRQHIEQAFNEATQNNLPGANQFGGPKFAAVVSGNSQQAKNLEAAVRALPQGDTRWNALRKGVDIMEGMGTRQPVGSQTAFNAQIQKWLSQGHPAGEFLVQAASPGRWPSLVDRVYRHVMFDRNTAALANLFTTGSVADLQAIAQAGKRSLTGQMAVISALGRQGALAGPQPTQTRP